MQQVHHAWKRNAGRLSQLKAEWETLRENVVSLDADTATNVEACETSRQQYEQVKALNSDQIQQIKLVLCKQRTDRVIPHNATAGAPHSAARAVRTHLC